MIFISHKSGPDHDFAKKLVEVLRENGISCWIAPESVKVDADHAEEIPKAINACEYFLLLLTEEAQNSDYVRKEVGMAQELKKPFIILKAGNFRLARKYRYLFDDRQFIELSMENPDFGPVIEKCRLGERVVSMEIAEDPPRRLSIMRGDYQENMERIMRETPQEMAHTVFAMGIDRSSKLNLSSKRGVLNFVCSYLCEKFGKTEAELQELIDRAKMEQLGHSGPDEELKFKDTLFIRTEIEWTSPEGETLHLPLQMLLIANSQKSPEYYQTHDLDAVEGIDSREIIIEVFNRCAELGDAARNLAVAAMGTNGLSFPYEVITAEIMNCFAYALKRNIMPQNLFFSVRESDMRMHGLTVDEVLSYIETCVNFFMDL